MFVCLTKFIKDVICRPTRRSNSIWSHFQTLSNNYSNLCHVWQDAGCVLECYFSCPIFRLYFDILDLILFCLDMLPVGSIKTTTTTKSIYPSSSDHTQLYSPLKLVDLCCFKSLLLRFSKSFLRQNKRKRCSSLAPKTPVML